MKESLAAAVLRASGWTPDRPLYDPFCGGGTLGIEAAWMAADRAPGLGRGFAFERLPDHDRAAWARLAEEARDRRRERIDAAIHLSDIDGRAVAVARRHARAAGVELDVRRADARRFRPAAGPGHVVTNPPYGERIGEADEVDALYRAFGDALKANAGGSDLWLFTALDRVRALGLKPRRRIPFFNGPLECRLLHVPLFAGGERDRRRGRLRDAGVGRLNGPVIVGDLTIWSAALKRQEAEFVSLVADLRHRGVLTAPACVFGQLLAECDEDLVAQKLRAWALQVPQIETPTTAWLAAGDLQAILRGKGVDLELVPCMVLATCVREDAELWSFDPRMREATRHSSVRLFKAPRL